MDIETPPATLTTDGRMLDALPVLHAMDGESSEGRRPESAAHVVPGPGDDDDDDDESDGRTDGGNIDPDDDEGYGDDEDDDDDEPLQVAPRG